MTNREQFEVMCDAGLVKSAWIGPAGRLLWEGVKHTGTRLKSLGGKMKGGTNWARGKVTGNKDLVTKGTKQMQDASAAGNVWANPNVGVGSGKYFGNTMMGRGAERAVYGAGRVAGAGTVGGAVMFAPETAAGWAGSYAGAKSVSPEELQNAGYEAANNFMTGWEQLNPMERMQAAWNPEGFVGGMVDQESNPWGANAYRRMYDPNYRQQGLISGIASEAINAMPIPGLVRGFTGNPYDADRSRNFIQRRAIDKMHNAFSGQPKQASVMEKSAWGQYAVQAARAAAAPAAKQLGKWGLAKKWGGRAAATAGAAYIPFAAVDSYRRHKRETREDMLNQAQGMAHAQIANQWANSSPLQRFGAALFPTAARMKMQQQAGPGYADWYQQTYGAPGQQGGRPQLSQMTQNQATAPQQQQTAGPQSLDQQARDLYQKRQQPDLG